jgi:lysozyme family protein
MIGDFDKALTVLFGEEGGYGADPKDPGNWTGGEPGKGELKGTKYGISAKSYPNLDIKNLTLDQVKAIYKPDFWDKIQGDRTPWPLCLLMFDSAVNQGPGAAIKMLQMALNIPQDGIMGVTTMQKVAKVSPFQCARFMARRAMRYTGDRNFDIYGEDWMTRLFDVTMKGAKL